MTDTELDQLLNRWRSPAPSPELRAGVLDKFPRREGRAFGRPLGWAAALAVVLCMLAVGTAQSGGTLDNFAIGVRHLGENVNQWFEQMWVAHIVAAFRGSNPKVYMDGELQTGAVFGGSGWVVWLRMPGEGKYYIALSPHAFEGPVPPISGRFDGHVLEFEAGGRMVRIESHGTYGFGGERPVYLAGTAAREAR
jgi:hypothetical protein